MELSLRSVLYMAAEFSLHRCLFKDSFGSGFWLYSSSSAVRLVSGFR